MLALDGRQAALLRGWHHGTGNVRRGVAPAREHGTAGNGGHQQQPDQDSRAHQ
jgi:hypothetical protein